MTILTAPVGRLADHVVTLRLPSPDAGDVATVDNYVQEEQLDGGLAGRCPVRDRLAACGRLARRLGWPS